MVGSANLDLVVEVAAVPVAGQTVLGGDRNVLFLTEPHRPPATLR